jgi:hypothetical protein
VSSRRGLIEPVLLASERVGELLPAKGGKVLAFVRAPRIGLRPLGAFADAETAREAVLAAYKLGFQRANDGSVQAAEADPEAVAHSRRGLGDRPGGASIGDRGAAGSEPPRPGRAADRPEKS